MARSSTSFTPGNRASRGRKPGSKGKFPKAVREVLRLAAAAAGDELARRAIEAALKKGKKVRPMGGELGYLTAQALAQPKAFLAVFGKGVEREVKVDVQDRRPTLVYRDFTGLRLARLGPTILARIEKETTK